MHRGGRPGAGSTPNDNEFPRIRLMAHSPEQVFTPYPTAHYARTQRVDAINTFRVSAGRFALFHVVWRTQICLFPQFSTIFEPGSIPGSSTTKMLVRATSPGQFLFARPPAVIDRGISSPQ
jgi:hypothetical protein